MAWIERLPSINNFTLKYLNEMKNFKVVRMLRGILEKKMLKFQIFHEKQKYFWKKKPDKLKRKKNERRIVKLYMNFQVYYDRHSMNKNKE